MKRQPISDGNRVLQNLLLETQRLGKPQWRPMLRYLAELHARSIFPAEAPFPYDWEDIGPGYYYGPAFGHWDIVHAVLDVLPVAPEHARHQLLNNLAAQTPNGLVPGSIWMGDKQAEWDQGYGHPPVWPIAVQDYADLTGQNDLIEQCFRPLIRQIGWFETFRKAEPQGFFYNDIVTGETLIERTWESGVDEGIRFDHVPLKPLACVDATSHVFGLYRTAENWAHRLGEDAAPYRRKADQLQDFIQNELFAEETGFFHDHWSVNDPNRPLSYEGMWPLVVSAATPEQARRVIQQNLLNPERFFIQHPISTVSISDPRFELRIWRGPAWNSMTYWAARGCLRYGDTNAARALLEDALNDSAVQFERTGTIWEYYHPFGGDQQSVGRKNHTEFKSPSRDYIGHNPLLAMTRMYDTLSEDNDDSLTEKQNQVGGMRQ
jgi:glycogen debranching enzyme